MKFRGSFWIEKCCNSDRLCTYPCGEADSSNCKLSSSYMFSIVDDFLFHGNLPYSCERMELDRIKLSIKINGIEKKNSCSVILTYYPEMLTYSIMLNFKMEDFSTDELVFLRQCFYNAYKFQITESEFIKKDALLGISEVIEVYSKGVEEILHMRESGSRKSSNPIKYTILEINDFDSYDEIDMDDDNFKRGLYGLLTCDEGWRHVPMDVINSKTSHSWGTRQFVKIIPFYDSCTVLNFTKSSSGREYYNFQKQFWTRHYGSPNQYFTFNPYIAGLNHGIIFSIESALNMREMLNRTKKSGYVFSEGGHLNNKIQDILKFRKSMLSTLSKLDFFGIGEIDELERLLLGNMGIYSDVEKIKYQLELTESDIMIKYQHKTNTLIILLTVANVIFALFGVVAAVLGSFDNIIKFFSNIFGS